MQFNLQSIYIVFYCGVPCVARRGGYIFRHLENFLYFCTIYHHYSLKLETRYVR